MIVDKMSTQRAQQLINNLLVNLVRYTDIGDMPKEDYENWLKTEIGFTEENIAELYEAGLFPYPEPQVDQEMS